MAAPEGRELAPSCAAERLDTVADLCPEFCGGRQGEVGGCLADQARSTRRIELIVINNLSTVSVLVTDHVEFQVDEGPPIGDRLGWNADVDLQPSAVGIVAPPGDVGTNWSQEDQHIEREFT